MDMAMFSMDLELFLFDGDIVGNKYLVGLCISLKLVEEHRLDNFCF